MRAEFEPGTCFVFVLRQTPPAIGVPGFVRGYRSDFPAFRGDRPVVDGRLTSQNERPARDVVEVCPVAGDTVHIEPVSGFLRLG